MNVLLMGYQIIIIIIKSELFYLWPVCLFYFHEQAIFKLIPKDEVTRLPADENTAEKRADKLWKYFDKGENGEKQINRMHMRII